jgi:flagellar M-ring protein FliF
VIDVSAVEFIDGLDGEAIEAPGILASVGRHAGTMINAAAFIVVVFLVAFFGLKPMVAALGRPAAPEAGGGPSFDEVQRSLPGPGAASETAAALPGARPAGATPLDDLRQKLRPAPQDRLARMVDLNEERTAHILRKWAHREEEAA